jgi:hypothetical protein
MKKWAPTPTNNEAYCGLVGHAHAWMASGGLLLDHQRDHPPSSHPKSSDSAPSPLSNTGSFLLSILQLALLWYAIGQVAVMIPYSIIASQGATTGWALWRFTATLPGLIAAVARLMITHWQLSMPGVL